MILAVFCFAPTRSQRRLLLPLPCPVLLALVSASWKCGQRNVSCFVVSCCPGYSRRARLTPSTSAPNFPLLVWLAGRESLLRPVLLGVGAGAWQTLTKVPFCACLSSQLPGCGPTSTPLPQCPLHTAHQDLGHRPLLSPGSWPISRVFRAWPLTPSGPPLHPHSLTTGLLG